jgi:hypothetical protein
VYLCCATSTYVAQHSTVAFGPRRAKRRSGVWPYAGQTPLRPTTRAAVAFGPRRQAFMAAIYISLYSQLVQTSKNNNNRRNRPTVEHIYSRRIQLQKLKVKKKKKKKKKLYSIIHNCVLKVRFNSTTPTCYMFELYIIKSY